MTPWPPSPARLARASPPPSWSGSCRRPGSTPSPSIAGPTSGSAACRRSRRVCVERGWRERDLRGGGVAAAAGQGPGPADAAAFAFAHAAPDAELLAVGEGVFEALEAHDAAPAHLLGLPRGRPPLGEEEVGVDAEAVGLVLPAPVEHVDLADHSLHRGASPRVGYCHRCNYNRVIRSRFGGRAQGESARHGTKILGRRVTSCASRPYRATSRRRRSTPWSTPPTRPWPVAGASTAPSTGPPATANSRRRAGPWAAATRA